MYVGAKDLRFKETDWRRFGALHLLACALATICTLGVYGILQQRIMTIPYGGDDASEGGDIFTSSIFLVFSNRACSLLPRLGRVGVYETGEGEFVQSGVVVAALEYGELHVRGEFEFSEHFVSVRGSEVFEFCA